jgi:hypothetical protein
VPAITIYEVFNVVLRESGENETLQAVAAMQKGTIADLTVKIPGIKFYPKIACYQPTK